MLTHLSIRHLTLVEHLDLEFQSGMSVVTGETGAGKSILLEALGLALGDRADSSLIAADQARAEVSASIDLQKHQEASSWLATRALEDDGRCILRRVVSKDGPSRAFVNGSAVTIGDLKSLSELLLDIHSQHEHQSLLKKPTHRRLLDAFGNHTDQVKQLSEVFNQQKEIKKTLAQLLANSEEQSARIQLLNYQAEELSSLAVTPKEPEALESEQKRLAQVGASREILAEVLYLCGGGTYSRANTRVDTSTDISADTSAGAMAMVAKATKLLASIEEQIDEKNTLGSISEMLSSAQIQIEEAVYDLAAVNERLVDDPERLHFVEARLSSIYEVARKHRIEPNQLPELQIKLQTELSDIEHVDEKIIALQSEYEATEKTYLELARKVTKCRQGAAKNLEQQVTGHLQNLGMRGACFTVSLTTGAPGQYGLDDIEFLIATNPGQSPAPLKKIVSGGELSRASLAIQVVTAKTSDTPTLVFDEVDAGIGGATAEVVGGLLRRLGADAQIICVTHLPQVAAQGHQHYVVTKSTTQEAATTLVTRLNEAQKVHEIARMLGGIKQTDQSLAHAKSMLASAKLISSKKVSSKNASSKEISSKNAVSKSAAKTSEKKSAKTGKTQTRRR